MWASYPSGRAMATPKGISRNSPAFIVTVSAACRSIQSEGYEAHIVPRSSTFKNYGILQTNSMGVVDYTYRGDGDQWRMPAYATRDVTIEKNARICQFRIMKNQPRLTFTKVEHLDGPDRGGFGSTGK